MKSFVDYLAYLALRAAWGAFRALGLGPSRKVLESVAGLGPRLDRRHRRIVEDNLRIAFPEWSEQRLSQATVESFRNWGRLIAEIIHAEDLAEAADPRPWQELREKVDGLRERGSGVLVLTAHTGNFELMARLWGIKGCPVSVFNREMGNAYASEFLLAGRRAMNVEVVERGVKARQAVPALQAGKVLAVPLDQNQKPGSGIFVEMFGKPACTSTMLARLSLATKVPVLPVFAAWEGDQTVPVLGEVIEPYGLDSPAAGREGRAEQVRALTARYTAEIEAVVRRYPDQWNWAHRRWKTQPDDATR